MGSPKPVHCPGLTQASTEPDGRFPGPPALQLRRTAGRCRAARLCRCQRHPRHHQEVTENEVRVAGVWPICFADEWPPLLTPASAAGAGWRRRQPAGRGGRCCRACLSTPWSWCLSPAMRPFAPGSPWPSQPSDACTFAAHPSTTLQRSTVWTARCAAVALRGLQGATGDAVQGIACIPT